MDRKIAENLLVTETELGRKFREKVLDTVVPKREFTEEEERLLAIIYQNEND